MKKSLIALIVCLSGLWVLPCQAAPTWDETARKVLTLAKEMDQRSLSSHRFINEDKAELEKRTALLKKQILENTRALDQATQNLNQISAKRAKMTERYQQETADMKTVKGCFRTALGHSLSRFEASPVAAMYPKKTKVLKGLLEQDAFPGMEDLKAYTAIVFSDISATGKIESKPTQVIGSSGKVVTVDLFRAGGFFLGYRDNTNSYFVLPQTGGPGMSVAVAGSVKRNLTAWLDGKSEVLPLDITDGTAIRASEQRQSMESWIEAGGVLLYPILAAGLIGAIVTILKAFHLIMQHRLGQKKKQRIFTDSSLDLGDQLQKIKRCPAARVIEAGLKSTGLTIDSLDNIIEEKILVEQGKMERFLSLIGVLASIAPLLGLLGTVTGMIDTFRTITIFGTSDPRMMSTGISEALVTTQAGLGIAIPLLLAHHFLKRRVARLVADMEESGMAIISRLTSG